VSRPRPDPRWGRAAAALAGEPAVAGRRVEGAVAHEVEDVPGVLGERLADAAGRGVGEEPDPEAGAAPVELIKASHLLVEVEGGKVARTRADGQDLERRREEDGLGGTRHI